MGTQTVSTLMARLDEDLSRNQKRELSAIKDSLRKEILRIFNQVPENLETLDGAAQLDLISRIKWSQQGPTVVMIVGVNGAGKTTTIGKLSAYFASQNKKILVAAGDTFRAAAQNQLKVWTERAQVEIFSPEGISDPSAVAFDAVAKAKAQNYDLVIIDTAGRLHTQTNLMEELKKVKRVIQKNIPEAPHEVIIVLDANSGQNALLQAKEFNNVLGLTGVILTKMDGTAKGGVAIGITNELKVPIKLIGIGEKISDLRPFSTKEYIDSIFN
jgi:fused signal recognition particle receptor